MIKREAAFTQLFRHWLKANPMYSAAFELKQTTTDSLPFSDVQEHQMAALMAAEGEGLIYKAPDDSRGIKPFDIFYLRHATSYIVIKYPHFFVIILARVFGYEKAMSARKSLTSRRARELSTVCVEL